MGGKVSHEYFEKREFVDKSIVPPLIHGAQLSPKALEQLELRRKMDKVPLLTGTILLAENLIRPVRSVVWDLLHKGRKDTKHDDGVEK